MNREQTLIAAKAHIIAAHGSLWLAQELLRAQLSRGLEDVATGDAGVLRQLDNAQCALGLALLPIVAEVGRPEPSAKAVELAGAALCPGVFTVRVTGGLRCTRCERTVSCPQVLSDGKLQPHVSVEAVEYCTGELWVPEKVGTGRLKCGACKFTLSSADVHKQILAGDLSYRHMEVK